MKMTRFSEPQILAILRQGEGGTLRCRREGASTPSTKPVGVPNLLTVLSKAVDTIICHK
jgi:hypothetical protein